IRSKQKYHPSGQQKQDHNQDEGIELYMKLGRNSLDYNIAQLTLMTNGNRDASPRRNFARQDCWVISDSYAIDCDPLIADLQAGCRPLGIYPHDARLAFAIPARLKTRIAFMRRPQDRRNGCAEIDRHNHQQYSAR